MQIRKFVLVLFSALLVIGWQAHSALAQFTERQMACSQEDGRLFNQMTKVSDWFAQYCTWNHRFPEGLEQIAFAKQQLNQLVPNIPYDSGAIQLAQGLDAQSDYANPVQSPVDAPQPIPVAASMDRIQINSSDLSMTNNDIMQYRTQPPPEWTAAPGTITAISNQTTTFVIWGAGRDGFPIRDPDTGRVRLIVGHYGQLFDNEE